MGALVLLPLYYPFVLKKPIAAAGTMHTKFYQTAGYKAERRKFERQNIEKEAVAYAQLEEALRTTMVHVSAASVAPLCPVHRHGLPEISVVSTPP